MVACGSALTCTSSMAILSRIDTHFLGYMSPLTALTVHRFHLLRSQGWLLAGRLDEASKPLTAFTVGRLGFFESEQMPLGLTNATITFQRLMEKCVGDLHLNYCIIYLDIIICSKTLTECIRRSIKVFEKLADAGLKLNPANVTASIPGRLT